MGLRYLPLVLSSLWGCISSPVSTTGACGDECLDENGFRPEDVIRTDVCIIGGGSSGTYAAIRLTDMGTDVVVVEKQDNLGGHTDTYIDEATGQPINVGVQLLLDRDLVHQYFDRLGVPLGKFAGGQAPTIFADFQAGNFFNFTPPIPTAFAQYAQILQENYAYLEAGFYLPNPVPEELLIPFGDFITNHGLESIMYYLHLYTQGWEIWKQPTLYVIKLFGLSLVQSSQQGLLVTPNLQDLYDSAARVLGSKVLYNSHVVALQRSNDRVTVRVRTANGDKLVFAKKLLMTAPPMLFNLRGWDLRGNETRLFNKFSANSYFDAVIKSDQVLSSTQYISLSPTNPFNLPSLPGMFTISPTGIDGLHTAYFATNGLSTIEDAKKEILSEIKHLELGGVISSGVTEIEYINNHYPFYCQVSTSDIRNGFYAKLYALQGRYNTWWSGAAWMQHDSAMLWEFTEKLLAQLKN